jgi:hypothetical protein
MLRIKVGHFDYSIASSKLELEKKYGYGIERYKCRVYIRSEGKRVSLTFRTGSLIPADIDGKLSDYWLAKAFMCLVDDALYWYGNDYESFCDELCYDPDFPSSKRKYRRCYGQYLKCVEINVARDLYGAYHRLDHIVKDLVSIKPHLIGKAR